jgi:mannose-1-phosphate guanylyltransferase
MAVPKCLVPIKGKALLDYWFERIFAAGIERALVNTHWLPDAVRDHVGSSPFRERVDLVHEAELLGTGGTILANRDWLGEGAYLVAHADNLTDVDVRGLIAAHQRRPSSCVMTMLAFRTDTPSTCGILELSDGGIVMAFHEKDLEPPGNLANAAVYICEPEVTARIAALGTSVVDLSTEVIPMLIGRILAVETDRFHRDIGTAQSLRTARLEYPGPDERQAWDFPDAQAN